jgi:hypothetical protein
MLIRLGQFRADYESDTVKDVSLNFELMLGELKMCRLKKFVEEKFIDGSLTDRNRSTIC